MVKKTYMERLIWGSDERVMPPIKCMNYRSETTGTTGPRRFGVDMNYRYYQWMAEEGAVWRENELLVLPVLDQYYRWSLTGTTGRVCSESNSQISNRFVFRSDFGRGKLRK
jgi:hypothetical protein